MCENNANGENCQLQQQFSTIFDSQKCDRQYSIVKALVLNGRARALSNRSTILQLWNNRLYWFMPIMYIYLFNFIECGYQTREIYDSTSTASVV